MYASALALSLLLLPLLVRVWRKASAEYLRAKELFQSLDADGDGYLTADELRVLSDKA